MRGQALDTGSSLSKTRYEGWGPVVGGDRWGREVRDSEMVKKRI